LVKLKLSQGYSPACENAGSLTPFEMTFQKAALLHEKMKPYHYQLFH